MTVPSFDDMETAVDVLRWLEERLTSYSLEGHTRRARFALIAQMDRFYSSPPPITSPNGRAAAVEADPAPPSQGRPDRDIDTLVGEFARLATEAHNRAKRP